MYLNPLEIHRCLEKSQGSDESMQLHSDRIVQDCTFVQKIKKQKTSKGFDGLRYGARGLMVIVFYFLCGAFASNSVIGMVQPVKVAVVVPGYLMAGTDFKGLCDSLKGEHRILAIPVPLKRSEWVPCLAGRSIAPILERLDATVHYALDLAEHASTDLDSELNRTLWEYNLSDFLEDFRSNPGGLAKVGGVSEVDDYPNVRPRGKFSIPTTGCSSPLVEGEAPKKIALVGHSAGGWICRAYLSKRPYSGKVYDGGRYVDRLVTLGTPHKEAAGAAYANIRWARGESASVKSLAVGSGGFEYDDEGLGAFTKASYEFCGFAHGTTGDGVTPLASALDFEGAQALELSCVHHMDWSEHSLLGLAAQELSENYRTSGERWYGSPEVIKEWGDFLN